MRKNQLKIVLFFVIKIRRRFEKLKLKLITKLKFERRAETKSGNDVQPIVIPSASNTLLSNDVP